MIFVFKLYQVGNSCRYLSLIDCRRGFARPPRSVQYYGKFPTLTLISGLPVRLHTHNTITRRDLHKYHNLNLIGKMVPNRNFAQKIKDSNTAIDSSQFDGLKS